MTDLAGAVLPLVRTRSDLHRWSAANAHGARMLDAVAILEDAKGSEDPAVVFTVTQQAIGSAMKVIMRADDSSGIIGDACRGLLDLHARVAARAEPPVARLVDWMIKFQFVNECDFFTIDPVAYAPALGRRGVASYRARLDDIAAGLDPEPPEDMRWRSPDSGARFALEWNARRLAVLDRDIEAVIRTHARDRRVAAWLQDTAEALAEIGEIDLVIDWAKQAVDFDRGHQSLKAASYWCVLLAQYRPGEVLAARAEVFRRWPSSGTAAALFKDAGSCWPDHRDEVVDRLRAHPRDAVLFALLSLEDAAFAWQLAHSLGLEDGDTWSRLVTAYQQVDPIAVLGPLRMLVQTDLDHTGAQHYKSAARRLKTMRRLARSSGRLTEVDEFIADLRANHRRRPRLQLELDRAGLP